jgi:hypothetical protein
MPKVRWEDVDNYMTYQPPNTDRSTFTRSNEWGFGSKSFKGPEWPKQEFDKTKCHVCGGSGRTWVIRDDPKGQRRRIKRSIPCPEECEYTKHW